MSKCGLDPAFVGHHNSSSGDKAEKSENAIVFDKYVIHSNEELKNLHKKGVLEGAIVISGDKKHVGIHKIFWIAQKIRQFFESIFGKRGESKKLDVNLCHAMIVTGWDDTKRDDGKPRNDRPLLAHSVMDGVKKNAVDYFSYGDKDVDYLVVYSPKDKNLRKVFGEQAKASSERSGERVESGKKSMHRSPFAWGKLLTCLFKKQIHTQPTETMKKQLAYTVADLLLNRKLSLIENEEKAREFYCIEYVTQIFQASVLMKELDENEKKALIEKGDREKIGEEILTKLNSEDQSNPLQKAFCESRICQSINPSAILSSFAAREFDRLSDIKEL